MKAANKLQKLLVLALSIITLLPLSLVLLTMVIPACENSESRPSEPLEIEEVKITMTLDSLYILEGIEKSMRANDGILHWKWLGDGFNNQNSYLFDQHCDNQEQFMLTIWPYDSLWTAGKLQFDRKLVNGNLNCTSAGFESIECNWDKVRKAAFANGAQPDFIHIFALNKGFGTGNSGIGILGIGTGMPSSLDLCDYWWKLERLNAHEDGHGLGLGHRPIPTYPANFMSQATNGGCLLGSFYLPEDQPTVLGYINSKIN